MDFDAWKRRPDQASLSRLLKSVEPRVYRICLRLLKDAHDAEEAKQEVLLEIASGLETIVDAAHFERWVGKVAFRTALDRRRMRLRRSAHENHAARRAPNGDGPDDALHEGMSRLDEEDRVLLIERYFDRWTLREMGRRHAISAVAVRKRIEKAHERLKRMLGCALPGGLWKGALTVGAAVVKTKTAAAIAVIAFPFLVLGGGVFVAATRRPPEATASSPPHGRREPTRDFLSHSGSAPDRRASRGRPAAPAVDPAAPVGERQAWSRLHQLIDRITQTKKRIQELKTKSRDSFSEEEGRRLQVEARMLEDEVKTDLEEVKQLAIHSPAGAVDFISQWRHHMLSQSVARLITQCIEAEIDSEGSPSSPLLAQFLTLARGDIEDRKVLLEHIPWLSRSNRDIGRTCLALLSDSDPEVRLSSAQALRNQAWRGNLKESLTEQIAALLQVSSTYPDPQVQREVLDTLAFLGTPAADEAVLQRFEAAVTEAEFGALGSAMLLVAGRAGSHHEARLAAALTRALNLPLTSDRIFQVAYLSFGLPPARCVEILNLAAARVASDNPAMADSLRGFIQGVENGGIDKFRHSMDPHRGQNISK